VKCGYAGFVWNPHEFAHKVDNALAQLEVQARPPRTIDP